VVAVAAAVTLAGGAAIAVSHTVAPPQHAERVAASAADAPAATPTARQPTAGPTALAPGRVATAPRTTAPRPGSASPAPTQGSGFAARPPAEVGRTTLQAPNVVVVSPRSIAATTLERIRRLPGVTDLSPVDVGQVRVHGAPAVVYGVDPATFRRFTPKPSAVSDPLWASVRRGELTASFDMAHELRLPLGKSVTVRAGGLAVPIRVGAFASMGLPDTDAVVDRSRSPLLGLMPDAGVVIAAPHADPVRLRAAVHKLLGATVGVQLLDRVVSVKDPGAILPRTTLSTVLRAAAGRIGMPYRWGATGPTAFDCSGLVGWAYHQAGIELPRTAAQLWYAGPHVSYADAQPGDLLFWTYDPTAPGFIDHVAIYAGNGMMIVAPHTGETVQLRSVPLAHFAGVVRVDPGTAAGVAGIHWLSG
jgi:hypothetical protein